MMHECPGLNNSGERQEMKKVLFTKWIVLLGLYSALAVEIPFQEAYRITTMHTPMQHIALAKVIEEEAQTLSNVEIIAVMAFAQGVASNDRLYGRLYFRAQVRGIDIEMSSSEESFSCDILLLVSGERVLVGDCQSAEGSVLWWQRGGVSFSFEELGVIDCKKSPRHEDCNFPKKRILW